MTDKSQILTQIVLIQLKSTNLSSFPNHFHFLFISSLENVVLYHVNLMQWPSRNRKNAAFFLFIGMSENWFRKISDNFYQKSFMSGISENLGILRLENNVKGHCRLKSGHFVGHLNRSKSRIQSHGNEFVNFRVDEGWKCKQQIQKGQSPKHF